MSMEVINQCDAATGRDSVPAVACASLLRYPGGAGYRGPMISGPPLAHVQGLRVAGILGGMSWESTATYYRLINQEYNRRLGGYHSAPVIIHSVDFAPIEAMQRAGDWDSAAEVLAAAAEGLVAAGAELLLLATNTMHRIFPALEGEGRRWLHIADATGAALQRAGHQRVALLGTRFTMEEPFYCQAPAGAVWPGCDGAFGGSTPGGGSRDLSGAGARRSAREQQAQLPGHYQRAGRCRGHRSYSGVYRDRHAHHEGRQFSAGV